MAKNLKRKRDQDAAVEEDEVCIEPSTLIELTVVQSQDSKDLMSADGLDPGGSGSETEIGSVEESEEEEWNGTGGGEGVGFSPSNGKHVKVPTGHEVREMKEASELYKSSAFKLQVCMQYSPPTGMPC